MIALLQHFQRVEEMIMGAGNHAVDHLVYHYLLARMDVSTQQTGTRFRVARGRIALDLSEKGGRGKQKQLVTFSDDDIDRSIARLCKMGLLQRQTQKGGDLVVQFLFEDESLIALFSAQNKAATKPRHNADNFYQDNQPTYDSKPRQTEPEAATNLPSIHPSIHSLAQPAFQMTLDWEVSGAFKQKVNQVWQPDERMIRGLKAKLMEFTLHWSTKSLALTQAQWEAKLWRNELDRLFKQPQDALRAFGDNVVPLQAKQRTGAVNTRILSVPNKLFGAALQDWGIKHGFRGCNPGEDDTAYRNFLRNQCERINTNNDRRG